MDRDKYKRVHQEQVLPIFNEAVGKLGEPTTLSVTENHAIARYDNYKGSGFELNLFLLTSPFFADIVTVELKMSLIRRLENEYDLSRWDRDRYYYNDRMTSLWDEYHFGIPPHPRGKGLGLDIEKLSPLVEDMIPLYLQFVEDEGKEERKIPLNTLSHRIYSRKQEEEQ